MQVALKTAFWVLVCGTVLAVPPASRNVGRRHPPSTLVQGATLQLERIYTERELNEGTYVGSEYCLACHFEPEYEAWRGTKHAQTLRRPMVKYSLATGQGVIADYDQNGLDDFVQGLDFNQISSGFDAYKPNAPVLSVREGDYFMTIGNVEFPIVFANGGTGEWRERYGVRIPATDSSTGFSDDIYFAPLQYNDRPHQWLPYKPQLWWAPDGQPKIHNEMTRTTIAAVAKGSFSKNCIGCHTTGIRSLGKTALGEWHFQPYIATLYDPEDPFYFDYNNDGYRDLLGVGCEMCHGPGSRHILGGGDPSKIVNPDRLTVEESNEVCGRCHNRQRSVPNKMYNWPYNESTGTEWRPGAEPLSEFTIAADEFWPDGETSFEHNQHFAELNMSAHMNNSTQSLRCFDCHDPHRRANHNQIRTSIEWKTDWYATRNDDNTLCLACHAGDGPFESISPDMVQDYSDNVDAIGKVVSAHSHHPYAPDRIMALSRCSSCHMPSVADTQRESVHRSHTLRVVPPEKTLVYGDEGGMPNACAAGCHSQKVNIWGFGLDPNIHAWDELFDIDTARNLMQYYGPNGRWWIKNLSE